MKRSTFWITNGVNSDDPFYIVKKVSKIYQCEHCFKQDCEGFVSVGISHAHPTKKLTIPIHEYEICKSCLYNPSPEAIRQNFITVSKTKKPEYFDKIINGGNEYPYYHIEEANRAAYMELIK